MHVVFFKGLNLQSSNFQGLKLAIWYFFLGLSWTRAMFYLKVRYFGGFRFIFREENPPFYWGVPPGPKAFRDVTFLTCTIKT